MCMHTSQHLLSAILETRLDLPTLSWSLTAFPTPSYVEIPRGMSPSEIVSVQEEANRLVFEGRQVHVEVEELRQDNIEEVPKLESGRSVGKGLPSDYTGGVKRVVVIDGVDRNPCVPQTITLRLTIGISDRRHFQVLRNSLTHPAQSTIISLAPHRRTLPLYYHFCTIILPCRAAPYHLPH